MRALVRAACLVVAVSLASCLAGCASSYEAALRRCLDASRTWAEYDACKAHVRATYEAP